MAGSVPTTQGLAGNLTWATGLEMPLVSAHYGKIPEAELLGVWTLAWRGAAAKICLRWDGQVVVFW